MCQVTNLNKTGESGRRTVQMFLSQIRNAQILHTSGQPDCHLHFD